MYAPMRTRSVREIFWIIIKAAVVTFVGFGSVVFLTNIKYISRLFSIIFILLSLLMISIEKTAIYMFMHSVRRRGHNFRRLVIVGTGARAARFVDKIRRHPEWGFLLVGAIDDEPARGTKRVHNIDVIGNLEDLSWILRKNVIDEVVFMVPRLRLNYIEKAIHDCEIIGVKATLAVDLFDLRIAKVRQVELDGIPMLTFETTIAREWQLMVKKLMDMAISIFIIVIFSPAMLFVLLLIKATSPGPVLFRQERVGLNGRRFMLIKFRTMYIDSEVNMEYLKDKNEVGGPVFKMRKDPRITPLGRILRKFSIDELPQLFNVFVGQMSLVGPRPSLPTEVKEYQNWQRRRLSMRPGLTCLWQIYGRSKLNFDEWMELDLQYLDNWSLWLDIKILVKTIPVVLFGVGAY
jgi:exopolysaccharide biosynthesis polyprenyl glycosylphosphotransferase